MYSNNIVYLNWFIYLYKYLPITNKRIIIFEWLFFKNEILKVPLIIKNIFYILSLFLLFGCQENIQRRIVSYIEKKCDKTDTCLIKINSITTFKWDKMYIFDESVTLEEVNKVLGFNYEYFVDIARRIIFTRGNKVIYHEDDYPSPDKKSANEIYFNFKNDTLHYEVFRINEDVFKVKRKSMGNTLYYELTPLI